MVRDRKRKFLRTIAFFFGKKQSPVTASGLTVLVSNSGGGRNFRTRPDRPWGPSSLLYNGYRVFPGGKAAGPWR